ncbi:nucleotide-binding alpha-beta plait domain-containing protein [Tanacetum coccineum]
MILKELVPWNENRGCKTLFMGNLNSSVKENDVYGFFESVGRINEVRISQRKKRSVPFAHVEFLTVEAARQAINLNGQKLHGRYVRLDFAEKRLKIEEVFAGDIGKMFASGLGGGSGGRGYGRGSGGRGYGRGSEGRGYGRGHGGGGYGGGRHGGFGDG